eukprot:1127939-Alexandrium_andersonii.AAC.1
MGAAALGGGPGPQTRFRPCVCGQQDTRGHGGSPAWERQAQAAGREEAAGRRSRAECHGLQGLAHLCPGGARLSQRWRKDRLRPYAD